MAPRFDRRLEAVAKAVGGGYCRLQMPLRLALGVRGTAAGHRPGALEGGGGYLRPLPMHRWWWGGPHRFQQHTLAGAVDVRAYRCHPIGNAPSSRVPNLRPLPCPTDPIVCRCETGAHRAKRRSQDLRRRWSRARPRNTHPVGHWTPRPPGPGPQRWALPRAAGPRAHSRRRGLWFGAGPGAVGCPVGPRRTPAKGRARAPRVRGPWAANRPRATVP